jgi:hypothetical protein
MHSACLYSPLSIIRPVNSLCPLAQVSEMALHFCERHGLMMVKCPSKFEIARLCKLTGATSLARFGAPLPEEIGSADRVSVDEIGGQKCTTFNRESQETTKVPGHTHAYHTDRGPVGGPVGGPIERPLPVLVCISRPGVHNGNDLVCITVPGVRNGTRTVPSPVHAPVEVCVNSRARRCYHARARMCVGQRPPMWTIHRPAQAGREKEYVVTI